MSKGEEGEQYIQDLLESLPKHLYMPIPKIIITTEEDSSQIDHVVVSKFGIFIIETKTNSGIIVGDTFASAWTQILGNKKIRFQNPVRQNYAHLKAVQSLFPERPDSQFFPIVVFVGDAELRITSNANPVVSADKLLPIIKLRTKEIIDAEDIDYIVKRIKHFKRKNDKQLNKHIETIERKLRRQRSSVFKGICPKCNSKMIISSDEFGQMLNCSSCDYIQTFQ